MIAASETFDGTWPFAPNYCDGNGFQMHYVDERADGGSGDAMVCMHGEPSFWPAGGRAN
jgi:haloalkane dehalogenase